MIADCPIGLNSSKTFCVTLHIIYMLTIIQKFWQFISKHFETRSGEVNRTIFLWYLFYQPMYEKINTCLLHFPAKENLNTEKALFDWPIVSQYDVKAKYRCVCIRSINQSNCSISVRLLFLFCWVVFISRSYENRSIHH